ncbi:MAG: SRPBCC family protein [Pseudoxanthomonas sp.]|nr:SRPBCC family protein [Pseudoxanthomonas sp.]
MPHAIRVHRILRAPPERVYRAFLDAAALAKWNAPNGFTATVHSLDARVGGGYRMSFTNFSTGSAHHFGGTYLELVPGERIVCDDRFEDPGLPGTMRLTIELRAVSIGTDLGILQEGLPDAIPAEACQQGWQESLALLALLVEPEIPDGP